MSESAVNNKLNKGGSRLLAFGNDFKRAAGMVINPRIPLYLKLLLPLGAALYWFWPMDLLPGLPIDDVAVLLIALRLFLSLGEKYLPGNDDVTVVDGTAQPVVPAETLQEIPRESPLAASIVDATWQTAD